MPLVIASNLQLHNKKEVNYSYNNKKDLWYTCKEKPAKGKFLSNTDRKSCKHSNKTISLS